MTSAVGPTRGGCRCFASSDGTGGVLSNFEVAEERRWAADHGMDVSARGRLPASVITAYLASKGIAPTETAPRASVVLSASVPVRARELGAASRKASKRKTASGGPMSRASTGHGLWRDLADEGAFSHATPKCRALSGAAIQQITALQERDAQLRPCPDCRPNETQHPGPHVVALDAADIRAPVIASTMRVRGTASGGGLPGLGRRR